MPWVDFRQAREKFPLAAVLGLLGFVAVRVTGDQVRGACPVHRGPGLHFGKGYRRGQHSTSFSANLALGLWQCFSCRRRGDVLDLWCECHGCSKRDAFFELERVLKSPPPSGTNKRNG